MKVDTESSKEMVQRTRRSNPSGMVQLWVAAARLYPTKDSATSYGLISEYNDIWKICMSTY